MADKGHGNDVDEKRARHLKRRLFMGALGSGAMAGLAGCGGDGGDGGGDGTTTTTATTTTTTEDDGDGGDGDDGEDTTTEPGMERFENDPVGALYRRPAAPPEAQYQSYSPEGDTSWDGCSNFTLVTRSYIDGQFYGEIASDWEYQPGLIDLELYDDWHYWTGEQIDADNVLMHWELEDFVYGGDELDAHENVVRADKTGDFSIRFSLLDTWRENFALVRTIEGWSPGGTSEYYTPWLERFRDAANQSEIEDLRTQVEEATEKDPNPFNHNPFKIVDATENKWIWRLRTEENNELDSGVPHLVDELNYMNWEYIVGTEEQRQRQLFLDGKVIQGGLDDFTQEDIPFDTIQTEFARNGDQWAFLFNGSTPPTNNPHFRRAIAYMINRKQYMSPSGTVPDKVATPFLTGAREERNVSEDILDSLTDYGWDSVEQEAATEEMEKGGFERNSNGQWLFQEGDRAGEPMEFTITTYVWQDQIGNQGTDFRQTMSDWGIELSVEKSDSHWGDVIEGNYTWAGSYQGGELPPIVFDAVFGEGSAFGTGNPQLPATIEAPPVGEAWEDYDGDLQTFETRTLADRLKVTQDDEQYQEIVDQLTWVHNQVMPRLGIEGSVAQSFINSEMYDVIPTDPEADDRAAEKWTHLPFRRAWNKGILTYNPDHSMG